MNELNPGAGSEEKHYDRSQETLSHAPTLKLFILHISKSSFNFPRDVLVLICGSHFVAMAFSAPQKKKKKKTGFSQKTKKTLECFLSISVQQQPFFCLVL